MPLMPSHHCRWIFISFLSIQSKGSVSVQQMALYPQVLTHCTSLSFSWNSLGKEKWSNLVYMVQFYVIVWGWGLFVDVSRSEISSVGLNFFENNVKLTTGEELLQPVEHMSESCLCVFRVSYLLLGERSLLDCQPCQWWPTIIFSCSVCVKYRSPKRGILSNGRLLTHGVMYIIRYNILWILLCISWWAKPGRLGWQWFCVIYGVW